MTIVAYGYGIKPGTLGTVVDIGDVILDEESVDVVLNEESIDVTLGEAIDVTISTLDENVELFEDLVVTLDDEAELSGFDQGFDDGFGFS